MKDLFKYFSDDHKIINGLFKEEKIRFTQPWALNDPLEFNPSIETDYCNNVYANYLVNGRELLSFEEFVKLIIIEPAINKYGILSLTTISDSFDMWNYYSNGHKGFSIGFNENFNEHSDLRDKNGVPYSIRKVEYEEKLSIKVEDFLDEENSVHRKTIIDKLFFKKTSRWSHENEYRMIRPLEDAQNYSGPKSNRVHRDDSVFLFNFSLDWIDTIAFGAHMSIKNKKIILDACEGTDVNFVQAVIYRDKKDSNNTIGKVGYFDVGKEENKLSPKSLLSWRPYHFCSDKEGWKSLNKQKEINSLQELPYYRGNENIVFNHYCEAPKID